MKLLHVISSIDPIGGGPVEAVRQISSEMQFDGHSVEILSLDAPDASFINGFPFRVHALGPSYGGYRYNARFVSWLQCNATQYDAVIVNGLWQYSSFATWRALAGGAVPYFVFTHGMLDPWFKRTYPLKHLKKWLYWPWGEYRVLRDARKVIFTCEQERLLARQSFSLYKSNEIVTSFGTAPPPVNTACLPNKFLQAYPILRDKRAVLFLGRIHEKKGCDLLINAFAQVVTTDERLHLVMAGPDQTGWTGALKARAKALGIAKRVTWTGMLEGDEKWGAFYACEAFCLPSHQENFGIAVAEALGCGKPVLISNKVNIWHEIEADRSGFIDDDTLPGTVRNLQRLLALDGSDYAQMCNRARKCFDQRFHIRSAAARLGEILQEGAL